MNTQITKDTKEFVVLTFKGEYFITSAQEINLRTVSNDERVYIDDGKSFKASSITDIMPIADYYKMHPDKKPEYNNYPEPKKEELEPMKPWKKEKYLKVLKAFLGGVEKNIRFRERQGEQIPQFCIELRNKTLKKISDVDKMPDNYQIEPQKYIISNNQPMFGDKSN